MVSFDTPIAYYLKLFLLAETRLLSLFQTEPEYLDNSKVTSSWVESNPEDRFRYYYTDLGFQTTIQS